MESLPLSGLYSYASSRTESDLNFKSSVHSTLPVRAMDRIVTTEEAERSMSVVRSDKRLQVKKGC